MTECKNKPQSGRRYAISICKLTKDSYPEYVKNFYNEKADNPVEKWAKDLKRHCTNEPIQMARKYIKRCLTALVIRQMETEITK